MRILEVLAEATNIIAEGEVLQLMNCKNPDIDETAYLQVIRCKTAKLFEAATRIGALLGGADAQAQAAMARYGAHLGTAFQLIDDVLDYSGDINETGKNIGDDLAEGKPTLPLIYALKHGDPSQQSAIRRAIKNGGRDELETVITAVQVTGALIYARAQAHRETEAASAAIWHLDDSVYRDALLQLCGFAIERHF